MNPRYSVLLVLLIASQLCLAQSRQPLASRLLRTIQIGVPQDITLDEIKKAAFDNNGEYVVVCLARSALSVLDQGSSPKDSLDELLDNALNTQVLGGNGNAQPAGLAPGFGRKELVLTLTYAMVMSGNQERAVDDLEKHLGTGSQYKHAVVMQALRNIGTPRALGLIQKFVEKGDDRNLGENTLADQDFPILVELRDRWNLVPPAERTRERLRAIVSNSCDQRTAMASYWLGFFPPHPDPAREKAELDVLRLVLENNTPKCEMMEHLIAMKSLGLRSAESMEFWARILRSGKNVWERHEAALIAWGHFGVSFAPIALDLLKNEPTQYIQWELMQGNFLTRKQAGFRSIWDIWIPSTLQLYLNFSEERGRDALGPADLTLLLDWLESGARPHDRWVQNHMLYGLAHSVTGSYTFRFLRLFNTWPDRNRNWWIIENLTDAHALPLLRYWSSLPTETYQAQVIHNLVKRLESLRSQRNSSQCCQPSPSCLMDHVKTSPDTSSAIHSETEARQWLVSVDDINENATIVFVDELKHIADVDLKNGGRQHWEYIYGCWHRTSTGSQ